MNKHSFVLAALAGMLLAGSAPAADDADIYTAEISPGAEEIYIFRTSRTERTNGSTPFCADAGFESRAEDYYTLWSMTVDEASSRVRDSHQEEVGGFRACFGPFVADQPLAMYAAGTVAGIDWTGHGACTLMQAQPPVRVALAFSCSLAVSGLPASYAGGLLVSSSLSPLLAPDQPADTHVPGFLTTSVVTLRLWQAPLESAEGSAR